MIGFEAIAGIIGSIVLFLYAIRQLSFVLEKLFTENSKSIIQRYTSNLPKSLLVGILITLLLDSSSAVIIITIIFINAGTIDLRRGIGIALGANIGTTLQSQLFAFDIMQYSFVLLLVGLLHLFIKQTKLKQYLSTIFYIGIIFFSLFMIGELVTNPEIYAYIKDWLKTSEKSITATAIAGGFFTLIIQSSGAMVGLAITLAKEGLLSRASGVALMMGAELGTTSDTLLAAIGGKKQAVQLAIFNLLFNTLMILIGLLFFPHFMTLLDLLFHQFSIPRQIANAHILFNVMGVLLVLPLIKPYLFIIKKLAKKFSNQDIQIQHRFYKPKS